MKENTPIKELIRSDVLRYYPEGKSTLITYITRPTFRYSYWLRLVHYFGNNKLTKYTLRLLAWVFLHHYEYKYGIHINSNIEIGKGLHIAHGDNIYIHVKSIGEHFDVYQGVSIGASPDEKIPTIEDNVTFYTGSMAFGDLTISKGTVVAANSVVTHSTEPNTVVAGVPAKIIKRIN